MLDAYEVFLAKDSPGPDKQIALEGMNKIQKSIADYPEKIQVKWQNILIAINKCDTKLVLKKVIGCHRLAIPRYGIKGQTFDFIYFTLSVFIMCLGHTSITTLPYHVTID